MTRPLKPKMIPDQAQEIAIKKMIAEPTRATLNASLMGTGKTLMGVEVALRTNAKTTLIIAPLGTFYGWVDTVMAQTEGKQTVRRIDSTNKGKAVGDDLHAGVEGFYFIGREYFRTKDWSKVKLELVLLDECHFAQNRNSRSFKVLMKLQPYRRVSMSGTPFGNKFEGAWAVSRWLWSARIPKSYWKWVKDWCLTTYSPFSEVEIIGELKPGAFAKSLPSYIRLEPSHSLEVVQETRFVDLAPVQRRIYDKFEKDLVVWLKDNPMIAEVPIAARIRLRQITLAVPSITDTGEIIFEDDAVSTKFKALKEIIDDNPNDSMLLLTDSQKYAKIVANCLGEQAFEWSGQASHQAREVAKQWFIDKKIKYIVAVIPAIAEGVDGLQDVCSTIVWLSHSDSNVLNQQVVDRIRRRGQKEVVKIYDIVARDTFDEGQISNLLKRQIDMNMTLRSKK